LGKMDDQWCAKIGSGFVGGFEYIYTEGLGVSPCLPCLCCKRHAKKVAGAALATAPAAPVAPAALSAPAAPAAFIVPVAPLPVAPLPVAPAPVVIATPPPPPTFVTAPVEPAVPAVLPVEEPGAAVVEEDEEDDEKAEAEALKMVLPTTKFDIGGLGEFVLAGKGARQDKLGTSLAYDAGLSLFSAYEDTWTLTNLFS